MKARLPRGAAGPPRLRGAAGPRPPVSALRPAPVLARLGLETDSADDDPVALETFSIVDNSLVWTVSAPPAGVRALSRLVLRILNPPTPQPLTSNL